MSDEAVQELILAVESKLPQESKLQARGLSDKWLAENALRALRDYLPGWQYRRAFPKQKEYFVSSFSDPEFVNAMLIKQESWITLDDEPGLEFHMTMTNGGEFIVTSFGNPRFLGDWIVSGPAGNYGTTNVAISFSLRKLLPHGFTNRERLSEEALRYMIADAVMVGAEERWDALGAEAKLGSSIKSIAQRFSITRSAINNLWSIDLQGNECWNADLHDSALPVNVHIGLSLPLIKGQLVGVESFMKRIDDFVRLARSPAWLQQFLSTNPNANLEIRFVEKQSLSDYAEETLIDDLTSLGSHKLARRVSATASDVAFLQLDEVNGAWSRWIVFPNREMMLWQFKGATVALWSDKDFQSSECHGLRCVGTIISENGKPMK